MGKLEQQIVKLRSDLADKERQYKDLSVRQAHALRSPSAPAIPRTLPLTAP